MVRPVGCVLVSRDSVSSSSSGNTAFFSWECPVDAHCSGSWADPIFQTCKSRVKCNKYVGENNPLRNSKHALRVGKQIYLDLGPWPPRLVIDGNSVYPSSLPLSTESRLSQAQELEVSRLGRDGPYGPWNCVLSPLDIKNSSCKFLLSPLFLTHHMQLYYWMQWGSLLHWIWMLWTWGQVQARSTQIGNRISCTLYGRLCVSEVRPLIKNGLFLIGGRDLIHQFLAFAYVFPYDKAVSLDFKWYTKNQKLSTNVFIVMSFTNIYNKLIKLIISWINLRQG